MAIFESGYNPVTSISAGGTAQIFNAGSVSTGSRDTTLLNEGAGTAYVGQLGVTSLTGFPVPPAAQLTIQGPVVTLYATATVATTVEAGLATITSID